MAEHAGDSARRHVRADIDTLTSEDVLRRGQRHFGWDPARIGKA